MVRCSLIMLICLFASCPFLIAQTKTHEDAVRADVLAALEKELKRFDEQAQDEKGPVYPVPSRVLSYHLLAGMAARGVVVKGERSESFAIGAGGRAKPDRVVALGANHRITFVKVWIQDRTGSFSINYATCYVRRDGKWNKVGHGEIATAE